MTNHPPVSWPLPKRTRPPSSPPSPSSSPRPPTKRSKHHPSFSKLESTLSSLSHTTLKAHNQANTAQHQLESLRTHPSALERENESLRESLKKARISHQQITKDLKIAQGSVRRLRMENDVLHRKYRKVKRERDDTQQAVEEMKANLEKEAKGHSEGTTPLVPLREEMDRMVEQHWCEVELLKEELGKKVGRIASTEKENKYLIRKVVELEDELDSIRTSMSDAGLRSKEHRRDLEDLWSINREEGEDVDELREG